MMTIFDEMQKIENFKERERENALCQGLCYSLLGTAWGVLNVSLKTLPVLEELGNSCYCSGFSC